MRYIPTHCLKPDQTLGADLIFDKGRILLRRGQTLTTGLIERVNNLGFKGVYIEDALSGGIRIKGGIDSSLRLKAQKEVRELFETVEGEKHNKLALNISALGNTINDIVSDIMSTPNALVDFEDLRSYDDYTCSHSVNVAVVSVIIGLGLGLDKRSLCELALGAMAHDLGRVFIDKRVINKENQLTFEEYEEVKRHCVAAYNYLSSSKVVSERTRTAILSHHEYFNGTGYPAGLSGNDIPLFARILLVADVFDALVAQRPFRKAMPACDGVEYIMSGYNSSFDPVVVDAFSRRVAPYPTGTCVRLSNNSEGIVIKNYEGACTRPRLRVINKGEATGDIIDLAHDYNMLSVTVKDIINI